MLKRVLVTGTTMLAMSAGLLATPVATATTDSESPTTSTPTTSSAFVAKPIRWRKCEDPFLVDAKGRCGFLTVPLDHAVPDGPTIKLAVSKVEHTSKKYRGVLFTNPGGPGGSGTWMAGLGQFVPGKVARSYDWIGLDPRGVGESRPALSCDSKYLEIGARPPYEPTDDETTAEWLANADEYAADCATADAAVLLPHVKTTDTVADLEALREALGAETVTFYGASYGTYIAQVYATLHPDRLDKLLLDGVVDPRGAWYQANLDQDVAFERTITKFFRWVARADRAYHLGTTAKAVERRYYATIRRLTEKPVGGVGPVELSDVTLGAGYAAFLWPAAAAGLSQIAVKGRSGRVKASYKGDNPATPGSDNGYAMYLATECTDAPWPTDWATWQADNDRVAAKAPFVTWNNAWFNAPCRTWPVPAAAPVPVVGSDVPVLLVNETFDGATPISGARYVRSLFPGASLVEGVGGVTHAAGLNGVTCVDNAIEAFLTDGTTPDRRKGDKTDKKCPGYPVPSVGDARPLPQRPAFARR